MEWNEKEIEFLKNNYKTLSWKKIAEELNRPYYSVHGKARELGLRKYVQIKQDPNNPMCRECGTSLEKDINWNPSSYNKYFHRCRKCESAYKKGWYSEHKEQFKGQYKKYSNKRRKEAIIILGSKCVACGFIDKRALQIDHKLSNGKKEREKFNNSGVKLYNYIISLSELERNKRYQLLCANCNWIKRIELGEN